MKRYAPKTLAQMEGNGGCGGCMKVRAAVSSVWHRLRGDRAPMRNDLRPGVLGSERRVCNRCGNNFTAKPGQMVCWDCFEDRHWRDRRA